MTAKSTAGKPTESVKTKSIHVSNPNAAERRQVSFVNTVCISSETLTHTAKTATSKHK
jgi:hypothetical protein